jgi:hypothetical protein
MNQPAYGAYSDVLLLAVINGHPLVVYHGTGTKLTGYVL